MDLAEPHDEAMGVKYANNDGIIDDNEDITPEDYMETPFGDGDADTDDDMDVIGGMNTPFGGPAPAKMSQIPQADIDGVDDIENRQDYDGNEMENDEIADDINNEIVTAGGPNDDGDIHPPHANMSYLSKAQKEHVMNMMKASQDMDGDDILNDINTGTPMGVGMGGMAMNMNDEGTDDEADYALEDDLIIDDDDGITIIDNEAAMKAKSMKQQEDFGQILGDDVMAQDLVMDDIVSEMNGDDDSDDELLAGMNTAQ